MSGLQLALSPATPVLPGLAPETRALLERFVVAPSGSRVTQIDRLIRALLAAGVWQRLDALYVLAAHDAQAARCNWVADRYNLTEVNGPSFVPDQGYAGDGVASYLSCNTTGGLEKFTQNDCHMGLWALTDLLNGAAASHDCGDQNNTIVRATTGQAGIRPNTSSSTAGSGLTYPGHLGWNRTSATDWQSYDSGVPVASGTAASAAITSPDFRVCGRGSLFGVNRIAVHHLGAGLAGSSWYQIYGALDPYIAAAFSS